MQILYDFIFDHPQSGVVYNFGCVCLSVCRTITFESLDVASSYLHNAYPVYRFSQDQVYTCI